MRSITLRCFRGCASSLNLDKKTPVLIVFDDDDDDDDDDAVIDVDVDVGVDVNDMSTKK